MEWAGPGSCETRFSWFAIDYPGRLAAMEGAGAAEMLPGQAGKNSQNRHLHPDTGKMGIKKVWWGFSNREEKN